MEGRKKVIELMNKQITTTVSSEDEEALDKAASLIDTKIKAFKEQYQLPDDIYTVLMCCLEIAVDYVNIDSEYEQFRANFIERVSELNKKLDTALHTETAN